MRTPEISLEDYVAQLDSFAPAEESGSFDRMMFDVCGEANHVRTEARRIGGDPEEAVRGFDRACARIYADPSVSYQRKFSLRTADWLLKAGLIWNVPGFGGSPTRWFDAWQKERNLSLLAL